MKSSYIGLWCLLAISLFIILLVALSDDLTIGSWTVKKAPFEQTLFSDKNAPAPLQGQALADSLQKEAEKVEAPMDSTAQSILLIGDSMTWNLAIRLAQYAKQNGHQFHAINWDSSNTKIWAESDTLQYFIKKYAATYVFISLGSNELYLTKPESHRKYVESIIDKLGGRPYVWIGPPNWKEDAGINDMIQSVCAPGAFFRSAGMTFERKKDKIHPTRKASALWIDSVARWMPKSSHPILMDSPADSLGKVNENVTFLKALNK
ncbi:MAG: SGNH/GDSL hydrolase family protein [Muribaculum sp.]|nr:SGNH/GDSL hydrolase family protein [Muribaculum sp.]